MTPNLFKDPDFKRFQVELQHTPAGLRFRRAWNDMHRACKLMGTPTFSGRGSQLLDVKVDHYQREYIKASERASDAVYELTVLFNWPTESQSLATFTWKPTSRALRQRRNGPSPA